MRFQLTTRDLHTALDELAARDRHIAAGLERAGYPKARRRGRPDYESLLRIIVGQQLSVKAAATIYGRLEAALDHRVEPERLLALDDAELRAAGLSRQKITYARGLSEAVRDGKLKPGRFQRMSDADVMAEITELKGFGRWSAEMFLLFALGRPDVWPADDLGIQAGLQRLRNMRARPDRNKTDALGKKWAPHRGAMAIFLWHYYDRVPLQGGAGRGRS